MATIEIPDAWLETTGLSLEEARDYLLDGYPVMQEICLYYMTSTVIRTPLSSIIGYARVILRGVDGTVTERQSEDLQRIIHSGEFLFEHLTGFIHLVSSVFRNHTVWLSNFDIKEAVISIVSSATRNCEYEIEYNVPDETLAIRSDQYLVSSLLFGMLSLAKQIRPTRKGTILVSIEHVESTIRVTLSTTHDTKYPFQMSDNGPFVFMAHSLTKELKGSFEMVQQENLWQLTASLPIMYE